MHVAALVGRLRQRLAQCRSEPGVIVGDDELDTVQAARLEPGKEVPPTRPALAIGKLDGQDLAPAVPVDTDRDQHRLADDDAALPHPFVARVKDQIGKGFDQWTAGKLRQTGIQSLVALIDEAEKLWPHSSSVIAFTLRVETPCTYISANAATGARSERWYRSNSSVENRPARSCGTRSSSLPTRVIRVRP